MKDLNELYMLVSTWQVKRRPLAETFSRDGLRKFVETHNYHSRQMMSLLEVAGDSDFYTALAELATNAARLAEGGKLYADGKDMTDV